MNAGGDRFLCICADDFGMSEGINAAVLDLVARAAICAASCMVLRGAWATGAASLRKVDPAAADLGLHLELNRPPSDSPAEPALGGLIAASYLGLLRPGTVRAQIREQLTRFEEGMGRPPAFVDGHRHVHQLPVVREALVEEVALRYGLAAPWIRSTAPPAAARFFPRTKAEVVFALGGRRLCALAAERAIATSGALLGIYGFDGGAVAYRHRLLQWIAICRSGDVLMCHPSLGDAWVAHDAARRHEYAVLRTLAFPVETEGGRVLLRPLSRQPPVKSEARAQSIE
ncbi:hopanoid biosynthesis associated protein HpnK [Variovorax sp. PBS-H4]|uniref:ChbG/HpnK family deacetylase n=1 Tax=Variovorax sp. PBS-H4 TaxID=434008 RepID=UPI001317BDF0|nr:ChbG/HpnK family deacetylase [Variovorax sp. PBS-H4]VTU24920.1 hopanoid biosynthesis associated protein HpnK [Variovorax sp. PBS-H4]